MREIKFDAIYKPTGEHFEPNTIDFKQKIVTGNFDNQVNDWCHFSFDGKTGDVILREYTGLKDKNGKEVFESDILKFDIVMCKGMIEEKTITFRSQVEFKDGYYFTEDWLLCELEEYEVIGNKFENPSLLEVQHD